MTSAGSQSLTQTCKNRKLSIDPRRSGEWINEEINNEMAVCKHDDLIELWWERHPSDRKKMLWIHKLFKLKFYDGKRWVGEYTYIYLFYIYLLIYIYIRFLHNERQRLMTSRRGFKNICLKRLKETNNRLKIVQSWDEIFSWPCMK